MEENLIGYLLKALDPATEREVEAYLRSDPDGPRKLSLLREAILPLQADRDEPEPPPGLRMRTLARVAEERCRQRPFLRPAPPVRSTVIGRSWWRRADVLVAASLLFLIVPLLFGVVTSLRYRHDILACQNNLHRFHVALMGYSDMHGGALPKVEALPPHDVAGIVVPILRQDGWLDDSHATVTCPANGSGPVPAITLTTLEQEQATQPERFQEDARRLLGCYAYSLGYWDQGQHWGLQRLANTDTVPIMADRPPFDQEPGAGLLDGNSRNHGGRGQNVLYLGGNVDFRTTRTAGPNGDDIFLNRYNLPAAGVGPWDAVLGASAFRPYPFGQPDN
jgi:hypothetical protein